MRVEACGHWWCLLTCIRDLRHGHESIEVINVLGAKFVDIFVGGTYVVVNSCLFRWPVLRAFRLRAAVSDSQAWQQNLEWCSAVCQHVARVRLSDVIM